MNSSLTPSSPTKPSERILSGIIYHLSTSLPPTRAAELAYILDAHGAKSAERGLEDPSLTTVITNSGRYEGWAGVKDRVDKGERIEVVTDKWVERSVVLRKVQAPQHFSPDPSLIFSGVVACACDLPSSDLEVLSAGITALGGQWRMGLMKDVTHLFALNPSSDKYATAMHFKGETGVKVLLPHWFDDAVRLGMGSLETGPYEWPDPALLRGVGGIDGNEAGKGKTKVLDVEKDDVKRNLYATAALFTPAMGTSSPPNEADISLVATKIPPSSFALGLAGGTGGAQVWTGRKILLSRTLQLYRGRREAVQVGIERAGGIVLRFEGDEEEEEGQGRGDIMSKKEKARRRKEAELVAECDMLVTRWRFGRAYVLAVKANKTIGTLAWLFHVQSTGILTRPIDQLLHYPVPKRPIEAFAAHVITVTNYTGEAREYLKKLITAMGAKFTPSMSGQNTVLIAAFISGTKAIKALSWSIPVVNHTWLEDCFIQWRNLTVAREKYIVFPPGVDFSKLLGQRGVGVGIGCGGIEGVGAEEDLEALEEEALDDEEGGMQEDGEEEGLKAPNGTEASMKEVAHGLVDVEMDNDGDAVMAHAQAPAHPQSPAAKTNGRHPIRPPPGMDVDFEPPSTAFAAADMDWAADFGRDDHVQFDEDDENKDEEEEEEERHITPRKEKSKPTPKIKEKGRPTSPTKPTYRPPAGPTSAIKAKAKALSKSEEKKPVDKDEDEDEEMEVGEVVVTPVKGKAGGKKISKETARQEEEEVVELVDSNEEEEEEERPKLKAKLKGKKQVEEDEDEEEEDRRNAKSKAKPVPMSKSKSKAKAKPISEEDDDDVEEVPRSKSKAAPKSKAKLVEEEDQSEEEERPKPGPKSKVTTPKAVSKAKAKAKATTPESSSASANEEEDEAAPARRKPAPSSKSKSKKRLPTSSDEEVEEAEMFDDEEEEEIAPKTKLVRRFTGDFSKEEASSKEKKGRAVAAAASSSEDDNDDESEVVRLKPKTKSSASASASKLKSSEKEKTKSKADESLMKDTPAPATTSAGPTTSAGGGLLRKTKGDARTRVKKKTEKEKERRVVESEDEEEVEVLVRGKGAMKAGAKAGKGKKKVVSDDDEEEEEKPRAKTSKSTKITTAAKEKEKTKPAARSKPLRVYSTEEENEEDDSVSVAKEPEEDDSDELPEAPFSKADLRAKAKEPTSMTRSKATATAKEKQEKEKPSATKGKRKKRAATPNGTEDEEEEEEEAPRSAKKASAATTASVKKTTTTTTTMTTMSPKTPKRTVSVLMPSLAISGKGKAKAKAKAKVEEESDDDEEEEERSKGKTKSSTKATSKEKSSTKPKSKAKAKAPHATSESEADEEEEEEEQQEVSILVSPRTRSSATALARTKSLRAVAGQVSAAPLGDGGSISPSKAKAKDRMKAKPASAKEKEKQEEANTSISVRRTVPKPKSNANANAKASGSKTKSMPPPPDPSAMDVDSAREPTTATSAGPSSTPGSTLSAAPPRRSAAAKANQRLHETIMPDLINFESQMKKASRGRRSGSSFGAFAFEGDEVPVGESGKRRRKGTEEDEDNEKEGQEEKPRKKRRVSDANENVNEGVNAKAKVNGKGKQKAVDGDGDAIMVDDDEESAVKPKSKAGPKGKKKDEDNEKPSGDIMVMTTQVNLSDDVLKVLTKLGVKMTTRPAECTHLLAPHLVRTEKFLCALAGAPVILTGEWANASAAAKKLLPEKDFLLKDKTGENKYGVDLSQALKLARTNGGKLLAGKVFYVTPRVPVDTKLLKNVVHACGGQVSTQSPTARIISASPETRYVISCKEDIAIWRPIAAQGYKIYTQELLLTGAMKQEMEWDREDFMLHPSPFEPC